MIGKIKRTAFLAVLILLFAACAPTPGESLDAGQPSPAVTEAQPTPQPERPTLRPGKPERVDTPVPAAPAETIDVPGEVMKVVEADLIDRFGSLPADLHVVRFEPVVWNDGSLGCPQPGVFYTQATVEGYSLVLQSGDTTYDYHIGSLKAQPVLCEQAIPVPPDSSK